MYEWLSLTVGAAVLIREGHSVIKGTGLGVVGGFVSTNVLAIVGESVTCRKKYECKYFT